MAFETERGGTMKRIDGGVGDGADGARRPQSTIGAFAVVVAMLLVLSSGIALAAGAEPADDAGESPASASPLATAGWEIEAKRTATSETFRLPDGKLETRIYTEPIHYRDGEGDWEPIEEELRQSAGGAIVNGDSGIDVRLPERLGEAPVRITEGDEWVSYRLLGEQTEPGDLNSAEEATYEIPGGGTSFEFSNLPSGIKEDIVLEDSSQPNSFAFELDASQGVVPSIAKDGSVEFHNADEGLVATMPPPTVAEEGGMPLADPEIVFYELGEREDGGWTLHVKVDPEWIAQADLNWPIRIDPTVVTEAGSYSCTMLNAYPLNYWCSDTAYPWLLAGRNSSWLSRSLLHFGLSSIPSSAWVESATLGLYAPEAVQNTTAIQVRRVTSSWGGQATWQCRNLGSCGVHPWSTPGGDFSGEGAEVLTSERGSQAGWWLFSGMKPLVLGWLSGTMANNGLLVKQSEESALRNAQWASGFNPNTAQRPYFSVAYYPKAPATSKMVSPTEGVRTARRLKLGSTWQTGSGTTGVTYQWKSTYAMTPGAGQWQTIPVNFVKDADGKAVSWPLAVGGQQSAPTVFFDAGKASDKAERDGETIYVRALFEGTHGAGGSTGYSEPVSAVIDPAKGNVKDATAAVGPGTLDLATGNFKVTAADVSIPGPGGALEFSRSINSREDNEYSWFAKGTYTVLGGGWQPSVPVEVAGGSAWRSARDVDLEEVGSYTVITDLEGGEYPFEWNGSAYVTPEEGAGWVLSRQSASQITLRDPSGSSTVFSKGSDSEYLPVSVSTLGGSGNKTQVEYELVGGNRRLSSVVAPTAPGVTCNPGSAHVETGCRVLTFHYKPTSYWGAPTGYGDRLWTIIYWGPEPGYADAWPVAEYDYNSLGRLKAVWDPRISPALKTEYTYAEENKGPVATLKPPGQEPWEMKYTARGDWVGDPPEQNTPAYISRKGWWRLEQVKRRSLLASPSDYAVTTIAYDVPVGGSGAPYDLSGSTVAKWAQQDIPTDATAIFPPDEIPSSSPPSAYTRATLYYMDAESQLVNTATPSGAGTAAASISMAETDEHGNIVRELTAQNRLRALASGSTTIETAAKAKELDTQRTFNAEGTEMLEERGPMHDVRLESGSTVKARFHRTIEYDNPTPPAGTPQYHLPTRVTTGASVPGQGIDPDQRVTETKYDWTLRKPTESIVDPLGLKLRTLIFYDASGLPIERRLPAGPEGGDARSTKTLYYSAGTQTPDAQCQNNLAYANLPCKILPASQPGTPGQPQLVVSRFASYSPLGAPTEVIESPGGSAESVRKTITTYDTAGRPVTQQQQGGVGTAIPKVEMVYSATTGRPTTRRFCETVCGSGGFDDQAVTTTYDTLGRATSYQDADGSTSTMTYDLLGRLAIVFDGKGTQARVYDSTTGLLTELQDSAAGTFTASYDADGHMVEQGLPNGLVAKTTIDEAGAAVHLSYDKTTMCSVNCTWLDFSAEESIDGQVLAQTSSLSDQQYSYDKAGRLKLAKDTPQGGSCTTRSYSFDANSNRTSLVTRAPGMGGACDTTSAGTTQSYSYDAADRLIGTGISYDNFGRISSLPGAYSGGGTLSTSYYSNDMVASQSQGGIANTYQLDSALRQRQRLQAGGLEGTEVFHYADASDSPVWTERGSSWTRNIIGIGGDLAAVQDSSSGVALQLTNLHGDVVGTASLSQSATEPTATFEFDEFGNPKQAGSPRYGWLGGKGRRTELPSGVVQMGVRSYVPAMGRFISTDPISGGSANAYDYANADPINGFDLDGMKPKKKAALGASRAVRVGGGSPAKRLSYCTCGGANVRVPDVFGPITKKLGSFTSKVLAVGWDEIKKNAFEYKEFTEKAAHSIVETQQYVEHWEHKISPFGMPNLETRVSCTAGVAQALSELAVTKVGSRLDAMVRGCLSGVAGIP